VVVGLLLIAGGVAAGLFGSLLGLGGGVLIVPLLTLGFGLPLHQAVGVSLVCVIMTSSAASGVYLQRHVANLRLGMTLELFTAIGALVGGSIAFLLEERVLEALFAAVLVYVAVTMLVGGHATPVDAEMPSASEPPAEPTTTDLLSGEGYRVRRLGLGLVGSTGAGVASALFGIGGGIIKVPVMHVAMGIPLHVATATSNLMIGITASASALIYLVRGEIDPYVAGPTAIGVFFGATFGSRLADRVDPRVLRLLFVAILAYTALQMLLKALG
jgi:uncharacterized membrane protein YfcA